MELSNLALRLFQRGLGNLAAYLAAHVLLCLVPAFSVAGGLAALVPKEAVTRFWGRNTPRYISYPAAAVAGSLLAVCSCTIVPLFAGIYKKGAGLGPAITLVKVTHVPGIMAYPILGTPALVINEQVKSAGRIPQKAEIVAWMKELKG
jgi:uncharacterized membrane protein YraQ (UPF0718 family)